MSRRNNDLPHIELLILKSLQSGQKRYGLEIRQVIEATFNRKVSFSSIYPKLELLEAKGFLSTEDDDLQEETNARRKYLKITDKGTQVLSNWENLYESLATSPSFS